MKPTTVIFCKGERVKMIERRKNQRFKLQNGNFVIHAKNIGKIEDISLGGFRCSCINEDYVPESTGTIEIRCQGHQAPALSDVNIRILKSERSAGESIFNVFVRKCHIAFEKLSEEQNEKLINFISTTATRLA